MVLCSLIVFEVVDVYALADTKGVLWVDFGMLLMPDEGVLYYVNYPNG